jgi:Uma2 family endonuclease
MSHAHELDKPLVTIAEFDRFLDAQRDDVLCELVAGQIVAMTNPTVAHAMITGNIGAPLNLAMRGRPCRVFQGDVRVQSSDDASGLYKPRPDIMVQCGPVDQTRNYVTDPLVIVEVLSPNTMDSDRGAKLRFYKTMLPTLRHIVLVYQDQMRVEHYRRGEDGWALETLTQAEDALTLEAIGQEILINSIYDSVDLPNRS